MVPVQPGRIVAAMTRTKFALVLATGMLGMTACAAPAAAADFADEASALQAVGFDTGLDAAPAPSASAPVPARARAIRAYLRKNTLHGEVTMKDRTIVVQRGTVTAVTATSVSVKSSDGFALTWTFGDQLRVRQGKKKADKNALKTGEEIGIAGVKTGTADTARLIAIT
jgi:hypothetical protein